MIRRLLLAACLATLAFSQSKTMTQGTHRMEISLERLDGETWKTIDPNLVLATGDRVRFRFRTNFDGFLYVTNQNSSGNYEQLFPKAETGQDNKIVNGKEYQVPSTSAMFRIAGPAGYETVYWLVTPAKVTDGTLPTVPTGFKSKPITLTPRCDDTVLKARGDCIDHSAGPKLVPRGSDLPQSLSDAAGQTRQDLLFLRQQDKAVISSPEPLTAPVIYEFRLAHR